MARPHLVGPISPAFTSRNLRRHVEAGACVDFHHDGISSEGNDAWQAIRATFPGHWQPDFMALQVQYNTIPPALWQAPVPIVGLAGDWNLLWHHYRNVLPLCDLVLTDQPGVEALARLGVRHVQPAQLFGCQRTFVEFNYATGPRDIDVLFVGNFNPAVQHHRLPWLGRI